MMPELTRSVAKDTILGIGDQVEPARQHSMMTTARIVPGICPGEHTKRAAKTN